MRRVREVKERAGRAKGVEEGREEKCKLRLTSLLGAHIRRAALLGNTFLTHVPVVMHIWRPRVDCDAR